MECYFCQQVFDKEKDLFQHVTRDHDVNPRELHCQYCSFSATTIGRYLWHMTTSHPRKNSHYMDGTGEPLSMAPYALDNEYESPQPSPKNGQTSSREVVGSSSSGHSRTDGSSGYEFMTISKPVKREYGASRERRVSASPPQSATAISLVQTTDHSGKYRNVSASNRYYGHLDEDPYVAPPSARVKSVAGLDAVRYVSILPNKFLPPDTSSQNLTEDLNLYAGPEDLSSAFSVDCNNVKSAFAVLQRKMNGNSAFVAAAFAAAAVADSSGKGGPAGSNRRKSKAPVRMAATPEELQSSNGIHQASSSVVSSSKRDRDSLNEGARNGNEVGNFAPILEEVMSLQQRSGQNNFPEDLSSSSNGHLGISTSRLSSAVPRQKGLHSSMDNAGADTLSRTSGDQDSEQKCPHCLIIYPDNVLYMLHKMLHTKDHPYRCAQCLIHFPNRYEFYAHIVNHGSASSSVP
jgi:hypothetical protein